MADNVIQLGQRQKKQTYQFDEVTTTGRTPWVDIGEYPTSCIHIYPGAGVEVSNLVHDTICEVVQANIAASTVVYLSKGARYVRVNWKTVTGGRGGAVWHGALQS